MSEDQHQHAVRQERIARASLSRLNKLADDLEIVTREIFEKRVPFTPENGADVMALSFVTKQFEHLRSVRALININAHRDALLIARTMLEGLGRLLWAFNRRPGRTDLWLWYGAILDWRQTLRNEQAGIVVDPQDKAELKSYVDKHGPNYYSKKVRGSIDDAKNKEFDYQIPADPWSRDWTATNVAAMFDEVGGKPLYDSVYRDSSEWIHWGPRAILRAMQSEEWGTAGFTEEDWRAAAVALQTGCQALLQSLQILDEQFSLGLHSRLESLMDGMRAALNESLAAAGYPGSQRTER